MQDLLSRRELLRSAFVGGGLAFAARARLSQAVPEFGRLDARPRTPTKPLQPGEIILSTEGANRHSILYVPPSYDASKPTPFVLALHGATGSGDSMLAATRPSAEKHGVVVLAPSSLGRSWDGLVEDVVSQDLPRVNAQLNDAFDRCNVDPSHLAAVGFSNGASFALVLGLINGDLFTHAVSHSAGGYLTPTKHGPRPKVFLSHGTQDTILPIDICGRRIAHDLKGEGYSVVYEEFDGGHVATPEMRENAFSWFLS